MPITRNAKKALRVSTRRNAINERVKKVLKEEIKTVKKVALKKDFVEAKKLLSVAYSAIDKAAKKGIIKKNAANRKKSRLSASVKAK
jgi:small subunit ribosomal protein S20